MNDMLTRILLNAGADFVGVANTSESLKTAISIGIAYGPSFIDMGPEDLQTHLADTKIKMAAVLEICAQYLHSNGYEARIPAISETLPGLTSVFSHKMAATMSGLGWVGKNDIFISSELGCGSRLATVFTNAPLKYGKAITKSQCGSCDKCVRACPCKAIRGKDWHAGISRDELLDPWLCKKYRDSFKEKLSFSHPCCLCIKACPLVKHRCST